MCSRLCGTRLADVLDTICESRGGFHTPREERYVQGRSANWRAESENFPHLTRRQEQEMASDVAEGEATFSSLGGVVDECCKKQCSLKTLVSYCAQQGENINLEEMIPSGTLDEHTMSADLANEDYQQIHSVSIEDSSNQVVSYAGDSSNHPNLGITIRNRPVFIVLPEQEEYL